jgi:hypothetical protein
VRGRDGRAAQGPGCRDDRAGTRTRGVEEAGGSRREGKGEGERERGGGAHLGIQKPAKTITGSPRAKRWEREVEERVRERELLRGKIK